MSMRNAEKRKQQKRKNRERRLRKISNIRKNLPDEVFRLDVLVDGQWRNGVKSFSSMGAALRHRDDTERRRLAGEAIVPGRVVDIRDGKVAMQIPGSDDGVKIPDEPAMKGALPDKMSDNPKTDKKGFLGLFK
jgi:hypothetical protein